MFQQHRMIGVIWVFLISIVWLGYCAALDTEKNVPWYKKTLPVKDVKESDVPWLTKWLPANLFEVAIVPFLHSKDLSPYVNFKDGGAFYYDAGQSVDTEKEYTIFLVVVHTYNDIDHHITISITRDKTSSKIDLNLLFLSGTCVSSPSGTFVLSPKLFFDVIREPSLAIVYPKTKELLSRSDTFLYISAEALGSDRRLTLWHFHNPKEKYVVPIFMIDDGKGGTYFPIIGGNNVDLESTIKELKRLYAKPTLKELKKPYVTPSAPKAEVRAAKVEEKTPEAQSAKPSPAEIEISSLQGKIVKGRYHSPKNMFTCEACHFEGESTTILDYLDVDGACVGFFGATGNFCKAEIMLPPGLEKKNLNEKALKDAFEDFAIGFLKKVDKARGIDVLKEEMVGDVFFTLISIEKMPALMAPDGKYLPSARGYLLFQEKDKFIVLTNQCVLEEKDDPKQHIEAFKQHLLDFRKTFEFGVIQERSLEPINTQTKGGKL